MQQSTKYVGLINGEECPISENETHLLYCGKWLEVLEDIEGDQYIHPQGKSGMYFEVIDITGENAGDSSIGELDGRKWIIDKRGDDIFIEEIYPEDGGETRSANVCKMNGNTKEDLEDAQLIASAPALKQENERLKSALLNLCNIAESETKNLVAWDGADRLDHAIDMGRKAIESNTK